MSDRLEFRQRYPRFHKGETVKMTQEAVRANLKCRGSLYGIVSSTPRRMSVNVRRIDQRTSIGYWAGFWRHLKRGERPRVR